MNYKIKQIGVGIEISSYLLQNVCTSEFECTSNMNWFTFALPCLLRSSKNYRFPTGRVFSHNYSRKRLHFRCLAGFWKHQWIRLQNTCKEITDDNWKAQKQRVHWYEKGYVLSAHSRLHCIPFPLFDFSSTKFFSFSSLHFIIHSIGTAIVKNKCCVFLESRLNGFCFIGNALSI